MSYYDKRDSYSQYANYQSDSRRNSNSFSEEQTGAKRKKKWPRRRGGSASGPGRSEINIDSQLFKEPSAPAHKRFAPSLSPGQHNRYREPYFDMRDMPDFVEPQHSGPSWHWDTYFHECKSWQDKHKLAYYRSRCMALEFENQMLFEQIHSLIEENGVFAAERGLTPTMRLPEIPGRQTERAKASTTPKKQGKTDEHSAASDSEIVCNVNEDMMNFLEDNIRNKLSLKKKHQEGEHSKSNDGDAKRKENESKRQGPKQPMGQKRKEEHDQLYGKDSAMIQALETSVQLNFNRVIDTLKPELFMTDPLNPEAVTA
uniref:Uncharacterized protein n=1 Tax=Cuerna arida TaxID=1464854 RepID=A0A1B6FFI4_9HEMI